LTLEQEARKTRKRTKTLGNIDIVGGKGGNSAFHEDWHEECEPDVCIPERGRHVFPFARNTFLRKIMLSNAHLALA